MSMNNKKHLFSGRIAFELYDTYGFPLDLTQMILREKGIEIDLDEFEQAMKEQKERSKANWVGSGDKQINELYLQLEEKTEFVGYDDLVVSGKILKLIKNNKFVDKVGSGDKIEFITDKTCFYGESGGQIGDSGMVMLLNKDGSVPLPFSVIEVENTMKTKTGIFIHKGTVEMGNFTVGDTVNLAVDKVRRKKITANHSATHLLHFALKQVLGSSVNQKGSCVDDERLRFDVSYNGVIDGNALNKVEEIVNSIIINNTKTKIEIMNLNDAKSIGATALFGEKYGDEVRVVSMGKYTAKKEQKNIEQKENYSLDDATSVINDMINNNSSDFCSIELCGGTHVKSTGDIGFFKIIKEESIASGIRRIEALTGIEALNYVNNKITVVDNLANNFKIPYESILEKINSILKENKELKKQLNDSKKSKLTDLEFDKNIVKGVNIFSKSLENINPQDLKQIVIGWQNTKYKENSVVIASVKNENKIVLMVAISKDLINNLNAVEILKKLGGRGGGVATFAMGSAGDVDFGNIENLFFNYL